MANPAAHGCPLSVWWSAVAFGPKLCGYVLLAPAFTWQVPAPHTFTHSVFQTHTEESTDTHCVLALVHTHTHTRARCRSNSHKLNPNSTVQTNKLPTLELFLFLCTPTFLLSNSWTKHCPESSHPTGLNPSRCSVPFRTFMWASGDCYSDTLWALIKGQPE